MVALELTFIDKAMAGSADFGFVLLNFCPSLRA
jgi:hypothetical protein